MTPEKVEAQCPGCGAKFRVSLEDIARQRTVRCPRDHAVELVDEGGGARKMLKTLSDLDKSFRNLGKR